VSLETTLIMVDARADALQYVASRQAPPLSTLWILAITQLELGLAVGGLAAVFAFTWWKGLSIVL
jgi:hypothetical protein